MKTFDFGYGPVPAHRHSNGRGWVANTASVKASAYVGDNARVSGSARVSESARIFELAHVSGSACVSGSAQIYGLAHVYGSACVYGSAHVLGLACVYESARVFGLACVSGSARVLGSACVYGSAHVFGSACVSEYVYGIRRSDGHIFICVRCADGQRRILAGCRYFTMPEAREHWKKTRDGTPLGQETMMILDLLELQLSTRKLGGKDASKDQ